MHRVYYFIALIVAFAACASTQKAGDSGNMIAQVTPSATEVSEPSPQEEIMDENSLNVLQSSEDPKELLRTLMALARSKNPADHRTLLEFLSRSAFLYKLDTHDEYKNAAAKRLRIAQVLNALITNDAPSAHAVFVALTKDAGFLKEEPRVDYLIKSSGPLRAEAHDLAPFWDKFSQPDDGFANLTIGALVENGTEPAMEILEKKMVDTRFADDDKIAWMHLIFVPHRDDYQLLRSFENMLTGKMSEHLKPYLVEVIFDYKPREWYIPAATANPPDRRNIGQSQRDQLKRLADIALRTPNLSDAQREAVKKTLEEIGHRE
jgi:hypothetical protein